MTADDPFDLKRFVDAQDRVIDRVRAELAAGRKTSHWMWFVFPQLAGLGSSPMSQRFAIGSRAEALAYLAHPLLGARLRECTALMLGHRGRAALAILGSPDDMKFQSCMTLFASVSEERLYGDALDAFFAGGRDEATLRMLSPN